MNCEASNVAIDMIDFSSTPPVLKPQLFTLCRKLSCRKLSILISAHWWAWFSGDGCIMMQYQQVCHPWRNCVSSPNRDAWITAEAVNNAVNRIARALLASVAMAAIGEVVTESLGQAIEERHKQLRQLEEKMRIMRTGRYWTRLVDFSDRDWVKRTRLADFCSLCLGAKLVLVIETLHLLYSLASVG